jgi:rRNA pseudouridine-1189 N-methylase Emg1 (Nep1/Mra1 family)
MRTKEFIKRVMEENNKELIKLFQSSLTEALRQNTEYLKIYITERIDAIPEVKTYTKEEIQAIVQEMIDDYDIHEDITFTTSDGKMILTADNKIFFAK